MKKLERYSGILIKCGEKVLLCKRSPFQSLHGIWSIPAGSVEKGETPKEGAIRELYEETLIDVDIDDLKMVGIINRYARDGKFIKGIMYVYLVEVDEELYPDLDNAPDGDEHTEFNYFSLIDLPFNDHKDQLFKIILKII
jgi:ADP-ribose pyrophosphatase YjhB (NUDIX family)